tara:strand:- start:599 stop:2275 length:1677 start_codon:yes stop_codon:yes gene_type:complete
MSKRFNEFGAQGDLSQREFFDIDDFSGGLNTRRIEHQKLSSQLLRAKNLDPGKGAITPRRGAWSYAQSDISGGGSVPLQGVFRYYPQLSTSVGKRFLVADNDSIYAGVDDITFASSIISGSYGSALISSLDNTAGVSFKQWLDNVYIANGKFASSGLKIFTGTTGLITALTSGTNDPPDKIKRLEVWKDRMFATLAGNKLRYSDVRDATEWPLDHEITVGRDDGQDITAIKRFQISSDDVLVCFKANAIWQIENLEPSGWLPRPRIISPDIGTAAPESVAWTPAGLIFVHYSGVYILGENGQVREISKRISPTFDAFTGVGLTHINPKRINQVCGVYSRGLYRMSYPSIDATTNDHELVVDLEETYDDGFGEVEPPWFGQREYTFGAARSYIVLHGDSGEVIAASASSSQLFVMDAGGFDVDSGARTTGGNQTTIAWEAETIAMPIKPLAQRKDFYSPVVVLSGGIDDSITLVAIVDKGGAVSSVSKTVEGVIKWDEADLVWDVTGMTWDGTAPKNHTFLLSSMQGHSVGFRISGSYSLAQPRVQAISVPFHRLGIAA